MDWFPSKKFQEWFDLLLRKNQKLPRTQSLRPIHWIFLLQESFWKGEIWSKYKDSLRRTWVSSSIFRSRELMFDIRKGYLIIEMIWHPKVGVWSECLQTKKSSGLRSHLIDWLLNSPFCIACSRFTISFAIICGLQDWSLQTLEQPSPLPWLWSSEHLFCLIHTLRSLGPLRWCNYDLEQAIRQQTLLLIQSPFY